MADILYLSKYIDNRRERYQHPRLGVFFELLDTYSLLDVDNPDNEMNDVLFNKIKELRNKLRKQLGGEELIGKIDNMITESLGEL